MDLFNRALLISGPLRARAGGAAPTILFASVYLIFPLSFFLSSAPLSINVSFAATVLRGKG